MLTSWDFGAGGDILGRKHAFLTKKCEKLELHYKTVESSMDRNFALLTSEHVLNKTYDAIINET